MRKRELDYKKIRELCEKGLSTYQIADKLGYKQNSVLVALRSIGKARKNMGWEIENKVVDWLVAQGKRITHRRGDAPYDILLEGERIDVKSVIDQKGDNMKFQLQCCKGKKALKDLHDTVDWFYLVFANDPKMPVYALNSLDVGQYQQTFSIRRDMKTGYNLTHIGNLEGGDSK